MLTAGCCSCVVGWYIGVSSHILLILGIVLLMFVCGFVWVVFVFFVWVLPIGIDQIIIDKIIHSAKNILDTSSDFCSSVRGAFSFFTLILSSI